MTGKGTATFIPGVLADHGPGSVVDEPFTILAKDDRRTLPNLIGATQSRINAKAADAEVRGHDCKLVVAGDATTPYWDMFRARLKVF
jgi:hypothetical protein